MSIKLSKVRLINWHFFTDISVNIGDMTLLAGDNGSGKSTVVDAIQYAMVADLNHVKFNSAASDRKAGRNLDSYCRGKIGAEDLAYIRGDCVTHVVLEFKEGANFFCAGIIIEAFSDGSRPNENPWIWEDMRIDECSIFEKQFPRVKDIRDFIKQNGANIFSSKRQYLEQLTLKFGILRKNTDFNPYLEALVRAVSFSPMNSVDQFVCNYILEDKPLDISNMKHNLENYRVAEKEAEGVKERISKLEEMESLIEKIELEQKKISLQTYLKKRLEYEISKLNLDENAVDTEKAKSDLEKLESSIAEYKLKESRYSDELDSCKASLANNDVYIRLNSIKKEIDQQTNELNNQTSRFEKFQLLIEQTELLLNRKLSDDYDAEILLLEKNKTTCIENNVNFSNELKDFENKLSICATELSELKKGVFRFPESTEVLKNALEKKGISSYVFADVIEVMDESWQNAVEGWLNTQRFNILVHEDDFQKAIEIYRSLPTAISGVGIPNLVKMKSGVTKKGSLAQFVKASNPLATVYIKYIMGDVITATIETLKDYSKSITKDCMKYSSFTASRIKEEVYSRWYIGKAAKEKRIAHLENEIVNYKQKISDLHKEILKNNEMIDCYARAGNALREIITLSDSKEKLTKCNEELSRLNNELSEIDTSSFQAMEDRIEQLKKDIDNVKTMIYQSQKKQGSLEEKIINLESVRPELEDKCKLKLEEYNEFASGINNISEYRTYYEERTSSNDSFEILRNFESALKSAETRRNNLSRTYFEKVTKYNSEHNESIPADTENSDEVSILLKKYRNTELPQYLEKISRARKEAEQQFMGDFVSRLSENILNAKENIREINSTLKAISFGRDRYRFSIEERQDKKGEIHVISKAAEISHNSNTIFDSLNTREEKIIVERLFETILQKDLTSPEVENICDYRKYFQYDIKMIDTSLSTDETKKEVELSLSKVIREKSGGEAQTPYYVAIAASFLRFFRDGKSTIRLALFDEAFNKMDDSRIEKTIDFFKKIGIQVVTAVPTEKIETIAPYMDKTNLVLRYGKSADVREYNIVENIAQ